MMTIYGIPNCNTVKKALDWLKSNHLEYEFHDFKKKGVNEAKLKEWFKAFGPDTVLNKKGLTWKKLSKQEQENINTEEKIVQYLLQNTSAIKRPIVEKNGHPVLISFDEKQYTETLVEGSC